MNFIKINRRFGVLTISSVFLLLLAGGIVRSSGSGMGCPDWPKCYGRLFPPSCSCELPDNYQQIYAEKRIQKAKKFSVMLQKMGMEKEAQLVITDPELYKTEFFNPVKAWIEYVNRLIGVLSGLFSLIFLISLLKIRKSVSGFRFYCGIAGFIMMLFNGWLGSIVVATNLLPGIVSIHYIAAYLVLALFMLSVITKPENTDYAIIRYKWYYLVFMLISVIQITFGTLLRQFVDINKSSLIIDKDGINTDSFTSIFNYHWVLAIIMVFSGFLPLFLLRKKLNRKWLIIFLTLPVIIIIQYLSGVINLKYVFPLIPQVTHIFFASLIFGFSLYICILLFKASKSISNIE